MRGGESIFEVLVERWRFDWWEVQLELMELKKWNLMTF
jgi:hypothetical protein